MKIKKKMVVVLGSLIVVTGLAIGLMYETGVLPRETQGAVPSYTIGPTPHYCDECGRYQCEANDYNNHSERCPFLRPAVRL